MNLHKFRWSRVYESSEEELRELLQARKLQSTPLIIEADSEPLEQYSEATVTVWCGEGSATLSDGITNISLQPGDAVRIDQSTPYILTPGITGCICYTTM